MTRNTFHGVIKGIVLTLLSIAAPVASAMVTSTVGNFQAYVDTLYDGYGNKIGIKVHYSVGRTLDQPGPAHYSAVCLLGGWSGTPCLSENARGWTSTYAPYTGYWLTRSINMNCNSTTKAKVQVHQPYLKWGSSLNFSLYDDPPRNASGQLFYSGSSETATIKIQGCQEV